MAFPYQEGESMTFPRMAGRIIGAIFGLIGIAAAVLTTNYVFENRTTPPHILQTPESATKCTELLMGNICDGAFSDASSYLYGTPNLELEDKPEDAVGQILWDAYLGSMEYEFLGQCYATENGMARDVRFTCLDVSSVTDNLGPIAQELFYARLENTEDQTLIYDEHNNYREEFIQEVLVSAVTQSLKDNAQYTQSTVTLQLSYHRGQWLVVPDNAFMTTVFGEITG